MSEIAIEFNGADGAGLPHSKPLRLGEQLAFLDVSFGLPEADEEIVNALRRAAKRR